MLQGGLRSTRIGCGVRPFLRSGGFRKTNILSTGNLSNPQNQNLSEVFGSGAKTNNTSNTVFGANANASGSQNVVFGTNANAGSGTGVAIGFSAVVDSNGSGSGSIAIGPNATVNAGVSTSIAMGSGVVSTASSQFVAGGSSMNITDIYFGNGVTNASPIAFTVHGTGGSGSNIVGGNVTIAGGIGTGTGNGGSVIIQTAAVTTSGSVAGTLRAALTVDTNLLFTLADTANIAVGSTTGTKIGTSTSQKLSFYNSPPIVQPTGNVTTALGNLGLVGSPTLASAAGRSAGVVAAVSSVAAYTVGSADGSFLVSANVLVTASTTHSFTVTVAYTDESNTPRTLTLSFSSLAGTLLTTITNATGAGPYEGIPFHIRCKASTTITVATTGTFTSVTYNVDGVITQIA